MAIFDLSDAKPLYPRPAHKKRTMDIFNSAAALQSGAGSGQGGFSAARFNRLTLDLLVGQRSADQDLFGDNIRLRARARKLALDNPYVRKFLAMLVQNVVGPGGIQLQAKLRNKSGKPAKRINDAIEAAWLEWCEVGNCTADGKFSFPELQQMAIKNAGREGENLVKFVYGREFNEVGLALQLIDNDQLDDTLMEIVPNGEIRLGVEVNQYRRPMGYWMWEGHPFDVLAPGRNRKRIPASNIVHTYICERPGQTRGYTWLAPVILPIKHFEGFVEAHLVASRASAAKFAVIQREVAEGWGGDDEDLEGDTRNGDGTQLMTANPGEIPVMGPGETLNFVDPRFPAQSYQEFARTILRTISSGLLVSYPSLGNDLEGVNFSSIRAGLLDERDSWRVLQRWFIDHFLRPVFKEWFRMASLTVLRELELDPGQWREIAWKARGWEWVDPLKDAQAAVLRLQNGFSTYADELGNMGRDFEETMEERDAEQKFIEALKLQLGTDIRGIADAATDGSGTAKPNAEEDAEGGAQP